MSRAHDGLYRIHFNEETGEAEITPASNRGWLILLVVVAILEIGVAWLVMHPGVF
jgi:hypothetical protein